MGMGQFCDTTALIDEGLKAEYLGKHRAFCLESNNNLERLCEGKKRNFASMTSA